MPVTALLSRAVLLLVGTLTLAMWAMQERPYDNRGLKAILQTPDGCSAPCFLGIQPGVTTGDEALQLLRQQEWVDSNNLTAWTDPMSRMSWISWVWNGKQPEGLVHGGYLDYSTYENRLVRVLIVSSSFNLGDLVLSLGQPAQGVLTTRQHIATFPQAHLFVVNDLDCHRFWQRNTDIYFMAAARFTEFEDRFDMHPYDWILDHRQQYCLR